MPRKADPPGSSPCRMAQPVSKGVEFVSRADTRSARADLPIGCHPPDGCHSPVPRRAWNRDRRHHPSDIPGIRPRLRWASPTPALYAPPNHNRPKRKRRCRPGAGTSPGCPPATSPRGRPGHRIAATTMRWTDAGRDRPALRRRRHLLERGRAVQRRAQPPGAVGQEGRCRDRRHAARVHHHHRHRRHRPRPTHVKQQ
jgi:hypothetical protein